MTNGDITYFAETDYRNKREKFGIKQKDRARHVYVIGQTGVGKSTLLENMAAQDIANGNGVAFLDPHGSAAEVLLDYIPKERINDVLYFAPFDTEHPISFNVLENVEPNKRHLVVAGLMSVFEKIWEDQWSSRMSYILQNTLAALLEYPGATLLGVNRMYVDKAFRKDVVDHVSDPAVKSFWNDEFANYSDRYAQDATPAIQNKIGQFISNPMIRNIIGQPTSSFDIREIMDNKKIMLVNLSKGQVGESNANLLGGMLITRIYLAALSRSDTAPSELEKLPSFNLFVDEFQSFANKSFADILSEARKYKLNLHLTHQYIEQMSEEVRAAVFGNVGTMVIFRVGAFDAEVLEKEFAPTFSLEDLVSLGKYQVYLKLMVDDIASSPFSARTLPPLEKPRESYRDVAIAHSRKNFALLKKDVEEGILKWHEAVVVGGSGKQSEKRGDTGSSARANRETKRQDKPKQEDRETQLRKAMSLEHLKPKQRKKKKKSKGPSRENISELRSALADVIKNQEKQEKTDNQQQLESKHAPTPSVPATEKTKEIPEDVLRKTLSVDDPSKNV